MNTPTFPTDRPVLFFDGVCGLCNAAVDFVIARDRHQRFLFAPLQGELAKTEVGPEPAGGWQTLVLRDGGVTYHRSSAALRIALHLGGVWRLAAVFRLIPAPLRDVVYDWVARNRYRWFGKTETCRLPKPDERARFLQ